MTEGTTLIKISKEYKAGLGGVWLGLEITIPEGKDIIESFKEQDELLDKAYMAMNPQVNWARHEEPIRKESTPEETGLRNILHVATTKKNLELFRKKFYDTKDEKLIEEFENKLKTLE